MKKLLIALFVGVPLVACTEHVIKKAPASGTAAEAEQTDAGEETADAAPDAGTGPTSTSTAPEDRCLDGQDMDAADVDVSACPPIPEIPDEAPLGKDAIDLGAWEIGTTSDGENYKYGTLSAPTSNPRILKYSGGSSPVNAENLECWAKGYYRLRKILQDPPAAYVALRKGGFQFRFFQFQTDLRNGTTGYREISSFQDHLVKWVTIVSAKGACEQPTLSKFRQYAKDELALRGIADPGGN
jgi:hypothetical protein